MSTIEEELRRLAAVAEPLRKATDAANNAIEQANSGIAATAPGIEIWLEEVIPDGEPGGFGYSIGVAKVKGTWQAALRQCLVQLKGDAFVALEWTDEPFALAEASRELRLVGAALLPNLIRGLTTECQRLLAAKQRATGASE